MNKCNCNDCCSCGPAKYDCSFDIQVSPYDPTTWVITQNGAMRKIKAPTIQETDTSLSTNSSNPSLIYKAEKHTDILTGEQIGDLINVDDLRDTDIDYGLAGTCYEFIYRKYGNCGEGCKALENNWSNFNINSEGAKQDSIRYVRGANAYGCPVYLDIPSNVNEYWFAGWKTEGEHKEFGYYQAKPEEKIPEGAQLVYISGEEKSVHCAPMMTASHSLYQSYHRGNDVYGGDYYYSSNSNYDLHLAPDSVHGKVVGASGASSDATCSDLNQDVIAIVHWCSDQSGSGGSNHVLFQMTPYHSGESWSPAMEDQRALHFEAATETAMPTSTSLKIPKGHHLVIHVTGDAENIGQFRIHQFSVTWLPANLVASVSEIIQG